jgi:hypothetical protein
MAWDVREFIAWIAREFEPSVRLPGPAGRYARQVGDARVELYGISDMACILYTIGALNPTDTERAEWAEGFAALQDPQSGYILEKAPTHVPLHNTAFALGAMELLGIPPRAPPCFARDFDTPEKLRAFLDGFDWKNAVYRDSHRGAGLGSIFALVPALRSPEWFSAYFGCLDALFDPRNGMLGRAKPAGGDSDQVGGTFHYHFLYEHFHRPMPFPEARIDAVLALQQPDGYWHPANRLWLTLDAVYLLTRSVHRAQHRPDDVRRAVRRVLDVFGSDVLSPQGRKRHFGGRLGVHCLTAVVSLLAEAQQFLGSQEVVSGWPLRLVLDRRPFI